MASSADYLPTVTSTAPQFDPVKFEVIRNALSEVTEEMGLALRRSAYSTNIKTRGDYSCVIFDSKLRFVASNFAQATHLGSMVEMVPRSIEAFGVKSLAPGDGILTNHPYLGGVHLNDVCLISPLYSDGQLYGYLANIAHHVDVGGGAPASLGAFREIYQEGVIIPPVKVIKDGEVLPDILALVLAQIRSERETSGDLRAQMAANRIGAKRMGDLLERYGLETVTQHIDELIAYTERRTAASLRALPIGVYRADGLVDSDGFSDDPVRLVVAVTIDEDGVFFDFAGSDPQRRAPINSTRAQTLSACAYVLKCLTDSDIPTNHGFYRFLRMHAPVGSVLNCTPPAPVVGGFETHARLIDIIFKALASALPQRLPAGTKGMMCQVGFGGVNPESGEYQCFYEALGGGYGGRWASDGPDAVQTHGQNTENAPIEEVESNYPVQITQYCLVDDSDGPGEFRGGLGLRRDYRLQTDVTFTLLADRDREGPHGLFGGLPGKRAEYVLNPDGEARRLPSKATIELRGGDVVSYRTCGGGGYGPPFRRDPARVLDDVRNGKVSAARATSVYGVELTPDTVAVDVERTQALRDADDRS